MKVHAPYKKFRWKDYYFPLGYRYCTKKEVKELKKCPPEFELILNGKVLNKPRKPRKE